MRIFQLIIKNFKGIKEAKINFDDHTVFIGPNSSGKSTIIEALALVMGRDRMLKNLTEHDFYGSDPKPEDRINLIVSISEFPGNDPEMNFDWFRDGRAVPKWFNPKNQCIEPIKTDDKCVLVAQIGFCARFDYDTLSIESVRYFHDDDSIDDPFDTEVIFPVTNKLLSELGFFLVPTSRTWDKMISFGSELFKRLINTFDGIPSTELLSERNRLRKPNTPLEDTKEFGDLIRNINTEFTKILPGEPQLQLRITSTDIEGLLKSIVPHFEYSDSLSLPSNRHGMGLISLQVIMLLIEFGRIRREASENYILAIEEPELHISPGIQRRLLYRSQAIANQTITTSHSPNVISYYTPTTIKYLSKTNGLIKAIPLLDEPLDRHAKNSIRKLFNDNRYDLVRALLQEHILIPEGRIDFEWFKLLTSCTETKESWQHSDPNKVPFGTKIGTIPTHDASITETSKVLLKLRSEIVVLVDGDDEGQRYIQELNEIAPLPKMILQWGNGWIIEDVIVWILRGDTNSLDDIKIILDEDLDFETFSSMLKNPSKKGGLKGDYLMYEEITSIIAKYDRCLKRASLLLDNFCEQILDTDTVVHNFIEIESKNIPVRVWNP